jgi:diguanylate cyclase (GGDEF)-like protein
MSRGDKTLINDTLVGHTMTGRQRRQPCLVQFSGRDLGRPYFVQITKAVMGRDPRATFRIDEQKVSRQHCELIYEKDRLYVRDLGSANGTYVNGKRIKDITELKDGDTMILGGPSFKYFSPGNVEQLFYDKVYREKTIDQKTRVFNDKYLMTTLRGEIDVSNAFGRPLSVIMYDLDHFKMVNDVYGHRFGDHVLARTAEIVSETIRKNDDLCRYGGEEFVIILRETDLPTATRLAERVRRAAEQEVFEVKKNGKPGKHIQTMSLGVVRMSPATPDVDSILKAADRLLYISKKAGRNRVSA